jgi:peptidoglycan/xylan/chitin deacetylase (PgdA/CDA1 family)
MLRAAGHEVGPHGWRHDARLNYLSAPRQDYAMSRARARFQACGGVVPRGIRTPWYCSSPQLFGVLARHFAYDSSVVNASALFSRGTNSGCATVLPYRARDALVELPLTLPVDTALDPDDGAAVLLELAGAIVRRGGVVVLTFHPQPHQSANPAGVRLHRQLLTGLRAQHGDALWCATPDEIVRRYASAVGEGR